MSTLTLRGDALVRATAKLGLLPPPQPNRATELLTELRRSAPAVFRNPPRPLMVGIREQIIERYRGEYTARDVAIALRQWCGWSLYLRALVAGAVRVDLDGAIAGAVTEEHAQHASEHLGRLLVPGAISERRS